MGRNFFLKIFLKETVTSAKLRIRTAIAYSSTGRVINGDIKVKSSKAAEEMVTASINESKTLSKDQQKKLIEKRKKLMQNGRILESYRTIDVDMALNMLTDHNIQSEITRKYFDML